MNGSSRIPTGFQEGTERRWVAPLLMIAVSIHGCQEVREGRDPGAPSEIPTAWVDVGEARALANAQGESVRIGVAAGAPEQQFVRINTARLVGDTVAVLDSGAREVRLFTRGGRFVRTIGRYGEGPGEFLVPTGLGVAGDTIVVWDSRRVRLAKFSTDGEFMAEVPLRMPSSAGDLVGVLYDGSIVVSINQPVMPRVGSRASQVVVLRFQSEAALADTLGLFPGGAMMRWSEQDMGPLPFAPRSWLDVHGSAVWVAHGAAAALYQLDSSGDTVGIIAWDEQLDLSPDEVDQYFDLEMLGAMDDADRRRIAERRAAMPQIEVRPAVGGMFVDRIERLWVKRYPRPGQEIEQWFVVTDAGALVGSVEVPAGTRLVDADQRSLLAVVRDEMGVQYLQVIPVRER